MYKTGQKIFLPGATNNEKKACLGLHFQKIVSVLQKNDQASEWQ